MAISDLAQRSGFTHSVDNVVFLQLELPSSRPELRELFSCQLQIDDGPTNDPGWTNEWRQTNLFRQLQQNNGRESGVVETVYIPSSASRNALTNSAQIRPLSLFGREALLEHVGNYGYTINARVRCLSAERQPHQVPQQRRIWLVRGEILSGGLIFDNPEVLPKNDSTRIWPDGNLRGIFFTGTELQIEIGPQVNLHLSSSLPNQQQASDLNKVRVAGSGNGPNGSLLFRARQNAQSLWGQWNVVSRWTNGVLVLNSSYTVGSKPKQGWQFEIYHGEKVRRFRLLGVTRDDKGRVGRAVWEQTTATSNLSHLPNEPNDLPIQPPSEAAERHLAAIKSLCDPLRVVVEGVQQSSSRPIVVVEGMNEPTPTRREYLRIDWTVTFDKQTGFASSVNWRPRTLLIKSTTPNNEEYQLLDRDEVEAVLRGETEQSTPSNAEVTFAWNQITAPIALNLPETRLVGTTNDTRAAARDLWFLATCSAAGPYAGVPMTWANVTAEEASAVPLGEGIRAARLSSPLTFAEAGWSGEAAPADATAGRATAPPGVSLTLTSSTGPAKAAKLELFAADVTLNSPSFPIYHEPLNDPQSVPNERRPRLPRVNQPGALRFIYRPEWARERPASGPADRPEQSVRCRHDRGSAAPFVVHRAPHAIRLYLPAEYALVDPVSVTRGNLVARQIVAFPLLTVPDQSSVTLIVTDVRVVTLDTTLEAKIDLALSGASDPDAVFDAVKAHQGFFAQFESTDVTQPLVVVRIRDLTGSGTTRTLTVPMRPTQPLPVKNQSYRMTVGPTRLALPRDVNHGLVPIGIREFSFETPTTVPTTPTLLFKPADVRGEEGQSVLALHPWSEWGPKPQDPRAWLTTGRVRLHHRNLIQEHAEFESSFEDRFPPEGPAPDPVTNTVPSPLLPLADFVRAVRDRYTAATGNALIVSAPAKEIRNWLPGSSFVDAIGNSLARPQVTITLDGELPEAKLETPPFAGQALKLRKADEEGADRHWLDVSVRPEALALGNAPKLRLTEVDPADVVSRRAVDSAAPLIFARHDICCLAALAIPGTNPAVAIVGSPESDATAYLFAENGTVAAVTLSVLNGTAQAKPLLDVVLLRHGPTIRGLALQKDGATTHLLRFVASTGTTSLTFGSIAPVTLPAGATPVALASSSEDAAAGVVVLTSGTAGVFLVDAETGAVTALAADAAGATAIDLVADAGTGLRTVAVGYQQGRVRVWREVTGAPWQEIAKGGARGANNPLLGRPDPDTLAELRIDAGHAIRALRLIIDNAGQLMVVAVDGTRFPCVWGVDTPFPPMPTEAPAKVWLQAAEALTVGAGRIVDLERRNTTDKLPVFALGLRSGDVRVAAAVEKDLLVVRWFDTTSAPVMRLVLPGGGSATSLALCFAGTAAGGLQAWDLRRGIEWPDSTQRATNTAIQDLPSIAPTTYFDALGVVRNVPTTGEVGRWTVDELSLGVDRYFSVTTPGLPLAVEIRASSVRAIENLTDVRLWADAFKVRRNGTVDARQFPDGVFDPGHIGFYSEVIADDELPSLAAFDRLPRLNGVPFFVTGVRKFQLTTDNRGVESMTVEGVLINPDEVAAGQDPADVGTLLGVVARAASRGTPVVVTFQNGDWDIKPESAIDWTFAVNRQVPTASATDGFPAKLARIRSAAGTVRRQTGTRLLCFDIDLAKSEALVFGRLWPFEDAGVTLVAHAAFHRTSPDEPWRQTRFVFRTDAASEQLTSEYRWESATGGGLVAVDARTMTWDGGRYVAFHQEAAHRVFVADRITGLAAAATAELFSDTALSAGAFPTSDILESVVTSTDNMTVTNLILAAGRMSAVAAEGRVEFVRISGGNLADGTAGATAQKASWVSPDLMGYPRVRLGRAAAQDGKISGWSAMNGLARLTAEKESPLPRVGAKLELTYSGSVVERPNVARVFGVDRIARQFVIAKDIAGGDAANIRFLQFAQRIERAAASGQDFQLTLSDRGPALSVGNVLRVVADDGTAGQACIVTAVDGPVVSGLTTLPVSGMRLVPMTPLVGVEPPNATRPTVRLRTDTAALVGRFLLIHPADGGRSAAHVVRNVTAAGFDLYQPVAATELGAPDAWRPVHPIQAITTGGGDATINLGAFNFPAFTDIQLSGIEGDVTLAGVWSVLPPLTNPVRLGRIKIGDGNAVTDPGTWSVNGSTPIAAASVDNSAGSPIVITTTAPHTLLDGDAVDIANVAGAAVPNGPARVRVTSPTQFQLYAVGVAPPAASGGVWERVDQTQPVTVDSASYPVVLSAAAAPAAGSRFRILQAGVAGADIFVAEAVTATTWEVWRPVPTLATDSCWSSLTPTEPGDGTTALVRSSADAVPARTSVAAFAFKPNCELLLPTALRLLRADRGSGYLTEEVSDLGTSTEADWHFDAPEFGVVDVIGKGRLLFDAIPTSGDVAPNGATTTQPKPFAHVEIGRCNGQPVAVTADEDRLLVWPVGEPRENVEPLLSLGSGDVTALAVCEFDDDLFVAALRATTVTVYRLANSHEPPISQVIPNVPANGATLAVADLEGDLVVAVGGNLFLSAWRVSSTGGTLGTPTPIWATTSVPLPVVRLLAGRTGGSVYFLVGFDDGSTFRVEVWSPENSVAIRSQQEKDFSPQASLRVDFRSINSDTNQLEKIKTGGGELSGRLRPSRRVMFAIEKQRMVERAFAQLEQGGYFCLTVKPSTPDAARGSGALVLWTAGDLTAAAADPAVGARRMFAAFGRMVQEKKEWGTTTDPTLFTFTTGTKPNTERSVKVRAAVYPSLLSIDVGEAGKETPAALLGTVVVDLVLGNQKLTLLLEGNAQASAAEMTGVLTLESKVGAALRTPALLQAVVRCRTNLAKGELTLVDDVFWVTVVTPDALPSDPEILVPTSGGTLESTAFAVTSFEAPSDVPPLGFFRLGLQNGSRVLGAVPVADGEVPLLPELEPSRMQSPERLGTDTVRLAHRVRSGLVLRPDVPTSRFEMALRKGTAVEPTVPTPEDKKSQLFELIVVDRGPLFRLRPEGWLARPATTPPPPRYRTDGLFVLNADFRRDNESILSAVEARTREVERNEPTQVGERLRYRELLRAVGAQGVAITFRLTDGQVADLGFVDSPFFDQAGNTGPEPLLSVAPATALIATLVANATATIAAGRTWAYGFDPRLRLPHELDQREPRMSAFRYIVADLPADPYADVCCLAHRMYRLERRRTAAVEKFDREDTPILHSAEVPAFRQPARLSFPLTGRWLRSPAEAEQPFASRPFFPPRVDWELAADKPGAMFQSHVQARVTNAHDRSQREPLLDFALREPQFVRISDGCVTAEVIWQTADTRISVPDRGFVDDATLVWTEVIGSALVDKESDLDPWLQVQGDGIGLTRSPLQLVIEFNSEVFAIRAADAAVPAYRVEPQPDEGSAPRAPKVLPAATYLVANPDVDTLFTPQTVAGPTRSCTVTIDSGVWKGTFTGPGEAPASGTRLTLTGFPTSAASLNDVAHRFIAAGDGSYLLTLDTATEDGAADPFRITIGSDTSPTDTKIKCRRPLCIEIESAATPDVLNGASMTATASIRCVQDGVEVTNLRLAQIAPGLKQYLIVTPTPVPTGAAGASGSSRAVMTQAAGYLELSVRAKTEVAVNAAKAWTPALTLAKPAGLKLVGDQRLVRLGDAKSPEALGIFGLFESGVADQFLLARPVVGNGVSVAGEGRAVEFLTTTTPVDLQSVVGAAPIVIKFAADPGWADGTPIAVRGVAAVPQANGTWMVKRVTNTTDRYTLYEPATAELATTTPIEVAAASVVPLQEAFPPPNIEQRLRRLKFDPLWAPTDRPLLQVHWAGAGQFPNTDGKGCAWRSGGLVAALYEQAKQVKFLANSQLAPKLAFVLTVTPATSSTATLQRTILFGDSAPPFKAVPKLVTKDSETYFRLEVPNNRESLSIAVPVQANYAFILYVVKSLPSGVAVYDRCQKMPGT